MLSHSRLADVFVEVADTLVADFELVDFLSNLTDHAADVSGADAVGLVLADAQDDLQFMAASNDSGKALELFQLGAAEGPCHDCYHSRTPVVNADLGQASATWPTFAPQARGAGFRSVHAFPMRLRDRAIGALNLFSRDHQSFSDDEVRVVQSLADIATIAILQEQSIAKADEVSAQLERALTSRVLIEQAKGALGHAEGVSVDEAFVLLRHRARRSGRKLVDVAAEVVGRHSS